MDFIVPCSSFCFSLEPCCGLSCYVQPGAAVRTHPDKAGDQNGSHARKSSHVLTRVLCGQKSCLEGLFMKTNHFL